MLCRPAADEDYESALTDQPSGGGGGDGGQDPVSVYEDVLPTYRYLCHQLQPHADKRSVI